ncbi:Alpha/Beta hydrolase protein [Trichophaea hybrida]|nr:Alpha/Beta hydrolase protein [Trichophaea hybrida]
MPPTYTLPHPTLGHILGALCPTTNLIQYRGLPYAHIPGRFRDPIPINSLPTSSTAFDGTKWGHIAVQQPDAEEMDAKILNTPVLSVGKEWKEMDELQCANLIVTIPKEGKKWPVIVWMHGGAYKVGSANFAIRGIFGVREGRGEWELVVEGREVQRQIARFGGDPENITYFGESAEAQHEHYLELCKKLNITASNPQQRAAEFLGTPAIDIAKLAFDVQTVPTSDGTLIPSHSWIRHENFTPNPQWCKSVLIGSCRDEWAVMALGGGIEKYAHPAAVFRQRLIKEAGVSTEDVELLFRLLEVGEDMEWEEQVRQLYVMISGYGFRRPAWAFADYNAQLGRKTYLAGMYMVISPASPSLVSHTYQGFPFDGVNKGRAHHVIDIVFSFQNFLEHFPKEGGYIELAKRMTTAWIKYAYGEDPWTPYNDGGVLKVFDVGAKEREMRQSGIGPEEWERWKVMNRVGLDRVWKEGQRFLESGPVGNKESPPGS